MEKYTCPYSKQEYAGPCQIKRCWARIKAERHGSGCAHQVLNKPELGVFELSYILNRTRKAIKDRLELSSSFLKHGVELIESIEDNRNDIPYNWCHSCGKPREHGQSCMNRIKCEQRKEVVEHFLELDFFSGFERPVGKVELNLLLADSANRDRISYLFDISSQEQQQMQELFSPGETT